MLYLISLWSFGLGLAFVIIGGIVFTIDYHRNNDFDTSLIKASFIAGYIGAFFIVISFFSSLTLYILWTIQNPIASLAVIRDIILFIPIIAFIRYAAPSYKKVSISWRGFFNN